MKEVSVIMPVYKFSKEVEDSISSVLNQTKYLKELLLIDDSGNNEVELKLSKKILSNKKLLVYNNEINLGSGYSRNVGVLNSKSNYIAFCDSDDIWDSRKLERQIDFMFDNKYSFTFTSYRGFDHTSGRELYKVRCRKKLDLWSFVSNTRIYTSTVILNKKLLENQIYFPPIKTSQDTVCWINILKKGVVAYPLDEILMSYREGNNKATKNKIKAATEYFDVLRRTVPLSYFSAAFYFVRYAINAKIKRLNF